MIKSKKQMFLVIGIFSLMLFVGGVTYAFFNYTRTGAGNTIRVGRIAFISRQTETINLTNLFPIDPTETGVMDDDEKVGTLEIEIEGDTDYVDGVEYLISTVNSSITSNGKTVPISLDVTVTNLGTSSDDYFTARESKNATIYKKLIGDTLTGDEQVLVGYIKPNTTSGTKEGVNGKITIKAYLDENKILISDTYNNGEEPTDNMGTPVSMGEGKTVLTTNEWNTLQQNGVSFQIKVEANEGIWVENSKTLYNIIKKSTIGIDIENGVDFSKTSEEDNTKGVYTFNGTENDTYPVYYYRGAVEDNNVVFNNMCWKVVRTTDTGGVKLIYNGETGHVYKDDNYELSAYDNVTRTGNQFEFDTNTNEWKVTLTVPTSGGNSGEANIKFTVAEAGNYTLKFNNPGNGPITATRGGTSLNPASGVNEIALNNLTTSEEINIAYTYYNAPGAQVVMTVALNKGQIDMGIGCDNTGEASQITLNIGGTDTNTFKFSTESGEFDSPAYNGYMYGDVYTYNFEVVSGEYYDSTFVWNGTNYTLTDSATTTESNNAHYSCGETSKTATCATLRYYYCGGCYIILTGGDGVEEALRKMQTNTNDSNAKDKIEDWYEANMTSYTNRIEDTIYCNDRSMNNTNGWNANGGDFNEYLNYGGYLRAPYNGTATPSVSCINKNDSFTWKNSNGNQKLRYPVGMITSDEMILAGGLVGTQNTTFYLNNGSSYWSLSPYYFYSASAHEFLVYSGNVNSDYVGNSYGLRPVVSLKPGTPVVKGSGTVDDPFIIE